MRRRPIERGHDCRSASGCGTAAPPHPPPRRPPVLPVLGRGRPNACSFLPPPIPPAPAVGGPGAGAGSGAGARRGLGGSGGVAAPPVLAAGRAASCPSRTAAGRGAGRVLFYAMQHTGVLVTFTPISPSGLLCAVPAGGGRRRSGPCGPVRHRTRGTGRWVGELN